jgi:hypothetical protein
MHDIKLMIYLILFVALYIISGGTDQFIITKDGVIIDKFDIKYIIPYRKDRYIKIVLKDGQNIRTDSFYRYIDISDFCKITAAWVQRQNQIYKTRVREEYYLFSMLFRKIVKMKSDPLIV